MNEAFETRGEELLTVSDVAARLRVKVSWVYSHSSELGVLRLGKYLRFRWQIVLDRVAGTSGRGTSRVAKPRDPS